MAKPETLPGLADIFKAAGVAALPMKSKPVVFVGTASGANQPFRVDGNKTVKSLWGLLAVKLGGWKVYESIKASDEARTNPGSEALISILKQARLASFCSTRLSPMPAISMASPTMALSPSSSR